VGKHAGDVTIGMALVAGLGVILMITALSVGVIGGSTADTNLMGLLFAAGIALFILGLAAWIGLAQPQKHFDDINRPAADEHHGHHDEHPAPDEHVEQGQPVAHH
jgi:ABC-type nickel/cobalt efflux system permease component RcnA